MATVEISKLLLSKWTTSTIKQCRFQSTTNLMKAKQTSSPAAMSTFPAAAQTAAAATSSATLGECPFHNRVKSQQHMKAVGVPKSAAVGQTCSVKSYSEIPAPKGLPIIGTTWDLVSSGSMSRLHLYCHKKHEQLGPIYRETLGVVEAVFVSDSNLIHKVYQSEGKYPQHLVPEAWNIYNKTNENKRGLFFMEGPEWLECRKSLNHVFLRAFDNVKNGNTFNEIVSDVLNRWKTIRQDGELPELENELYKWSIESLCSVIFGKRMGCFRDDQANEMHKFVHFTQQIFLESAKMTVIPAKLAHKLRLPVWRRFVKAVSSALKIAKSLVEEHLEEMQRKAANNEEVDGILANLAKDSKLETEQLVRIVTDLIIAAADTTSHAVQWALYLVAKNGDWQEKAASEIDQVVPRGELVQPHHLTSMPLIKAMVKESLRLYPVAPLLTRILPEDLRLGGYHIPAGKLVLMSLYTTGRDPKYFTNPNVFNPGRWLRKDNVREVTGTHACLPFGIGARACIGRRVAELQMHLLLARTIQQFRMEVANENDVDIRVKMLTTPSENIRLRLTDRT